MKILFIFRGDNERTDRKYVSALTCFPNWKETLFQDCKDNNHEYETAFITYDSPVLQEIKDIIKPDYLIINKRISQGENFGDVLNFICQNKEKYDRFIILRCDMIFKFKLSEWPKIWTNGIFLLMKDYGYDSNKLYSDFIFIVDRNRLDDIIAAYQKTRSHYTYPTLHYIGTFMELNKIPFQIMYEGQHHGHPDNPLVKWLVA